MNDNWVEVCLLEELEEEDVMRFDYGNLTFAIYRMKGPKVFATDGLCTHGNVHLSEGLVMDNLIECPKHNGRFDYTTGKALRAPVCLNLKTYPVKIVSARIFLNVGHAVNS